MPVVKCNECELKTAEIARLKDRLDIRRGDDGEQADEIDRLTFQLSQLQFHKDDVDATNRRLRAEVVPLQKRLAGLTDDNAKWKATAGELERQRAELEALVREARCPTCAATASYMASPADEDDCEWCKVRESLLSGETKPQKDPPGVPAMQAMLHSEGTK